MAAEGRTEPLANPTRSRIEVPLMHRVVRRLAIAFSLATLVIALGASATLALSPNAGCQAHFTLEGSNPGQLQRHQHWSGFGYEEVRMVSRYPGSSFEECEQVFEPQ